MNRSSFLPKRSLCISASRKNAGFTIIEVAIAGFILTLAIASSLLAIQTGFKMMDTARTTALADQVLQSQIEDLRLMSWDTLSTTYTAAKTAGATQTVSLTSTLSSEIKAQGITLDLKVTGQSGNIATLLVTASWQNHITKKKQTRSYQTLYAQNGLSDYFVTRH